MTKNNSVKQMVDGLKTLGPMTENEITKTCFGYDRNKSYGESNKKYADMLRRGLKKGLIGRVETYPGWKGSYHSKAKFVYYAIRPDSEIWPNRVFCSKELDMEMANESI